MLCPFELQLRFSPIANWAAITDPSPFRFPGGRGARWTGTASLPTCDLEDPHRLIGVGGWKEGEESSRHADWPIDPTLFLYAGTKVHTSCNKRNFKWNECVAAPTKSWMWSCLFFADFAGLVKRAGPRLRELTYWPTQAVEVSSCNVGPRLFYHPGLVPVYLDVRLDAIPSSGSSDLAEVFFKS